MDEFGCDYDYRTVGESIMKYNIPDEWKAVFDAYDDAYPLVSIPVAQIRRSPAIMDLKLRVVEDPDAEYAGCVILTSEQTIAFKVDYMCDLISAMNAK